MPSRKKLQGKARKAAKQQQQQNSKDADDDDALLEEAIKLSIAERDALEATGAAEHSDGNEKCRHGFAQLPKGHICLQFVQKYKEEYEEKADADMNIGMVLTTSFLSLYEKYPEVCKDSDKMDLVASYCLYTGTEQLLLGIADNARVYATFACFFDEMKEVFLNVAQATPNWTKAIELNTADEHTLVQYFRKRNPCSCLDGKYNEAKSITKMGRCCNSTCTLPDKKAKRGAMFYCTGCRLANYCSRECQVADWGRHKEGCKAAVAAAESYKRLAETYKRLK